MVSVATIQGEGLAALTAGLGADDVARVEKALAEVEPLYADQKLSSGQDALQFVLSVASVLTALNTDAQTPIAGLLFEPQILHPGLEQQWGQQVC